MKPSYYNYSMALEDKMTLLFNFYTLNLIALSPCESKSVEKILKNPDESLKSKQASELRKTLIEKGFIIDDRVNELEHLKVYHFQSRIRRNHLGLTILPTLNCNFDCIYCYQDKKKQKMGQEIEEALIRFVKSKVVNKGGLSVSWFGGEPLLEMDIIERLSSAFIQICQDNDAKYSATITTNGYLLDRENAEKLQKLQVEKAQITIDGPPDVHNRRKPLKSGGGTFKRMLDNIKGASEKIRIDVRMNVDSKNRDYILDLLDILMKEGLEKRVGFYLGRTYPYTDVCSDVSGWCLADEDFSLLKLETAMKIVDRGFDSFSIPQSKNHHCMADSVNAYCIMPSGGIVKCWNDVSNPEVEIGHLLKPTTKKMIKNAERWLRRDPFELECVSCLLLPICMGGCPYLFELTGKVHCHRWRHHLKESLLLYYCGKIMQQEGEIIQEFWELVESVKELKTVAEYKN